ncbi:MAG: ATP-binding protein [Mariprofundaceae bacterium]
MNRLFWKLFLWFWLAMALMAGATSWLTQQWLAEDQLISERAAVMQSQAGTAVALYEQLGAGGLRRWLRALARTDHIHGVLIDQEGFNVLNENISPPMQQLAIELGNSDGAVTMSRWPQVQSGVKLSSPLGATYYWMAATRIPRQAMHEGMEDARWARIAVAVMIAVLMCWLLSRYLTKPIRQLQHAAAKLGKGDLSARSLPAMGARFDELGDLGRSFDDMAAQLETLVQCQKQLLRDISHELRSPLARLQVALELARQKSGKTVEVELSRIETEAMRLNDLIGDVLMLAKLDNTDPSAEGHRIDMVELVKDVARDAAFEAEAQNKAVRLAHADPAAEIHGHAQLLRSAVENVLRNAVRHTPRDTTAEISLSMNQDEQQAVITVRDFGPGVPEHALARLFEPFYRVSEARERNNGGYGVGLAIAARAARLHHGSIQAENHTDGGLRVTIRLPLTQGKEATA